MPSRENKVILLSATTALILAYGGRSLMNFDDTLFIGILLFLGVVAPQLLNNYLDTLDAD